MTLQAFFNNEFIKEDYLYQVKQHQLAGEIIKGKYWKNGKGCAIGCTIHDSEHAKYETQLGIPIWLARIEDTIFEALPNKIAEKWPVEFLEAISLGVNLEKIKIPILIFIVKFVDKGTKNKRSFNITNNILIKELKKPTIDLEKLRVISISSQSHIASLTANAVIYTAPTYIADAIKSSFIRQSDYVKLTNKLLELIRGCK